MSPIKASDLYDLFFNFLDFVERVWIYLSTPLGDLAGDAMPVWMPDWIAQIIGDGLFGILQNLSVLDIVCGSGLALFFVLLIIKYIIPT